MAITVLKQGMRGAEVQTLQTALNLLGFPCGKADGVFGERTEDAVEDFQEKQGIRVDGVAGNGTATALNAALVKAGSPLRLVLAAPAVQPLQPPSTRLAEVSCPADKVPGKSGYSTNSFRSDVAAHYKAMYAEVHAKGGVVTSSGSVRPLSSGSSPARSKTSLHYLKIAFDLALSTGMQSENDPYLITVDPDGRWRVWFRSEHAEAVERDLEIVLASTVKGVFKVTKKTIRAKVICFTEIAAKYGFKGIKARRKFWTGGGYDYAEFWHFQDESVLTRGKSVFGEELLKVYSESTCKAFQYWGEVKNDVFGVDWG